MIPSESDVLYRGTAAGTSEPLRQHRCQGCGYIFDPVIGCNECAARSVEAEIGREAVEIMDEFHVMEVAARYSKPEAE